MKIINPRIIDAVKPLNLPRGEYAVFGSALLEIYGIRDSGDIDFIVTKKLYDQLAATPDWTEFQYDNGDRALRSSSSQFDVAFYECTWIPNGLEPDLLGFISRAVQVDGVSFVSFEDTIAWKSALAREKDLHDIELIKNLLAKGES